MFIRFAFAASVSLVLLPGCLVSPDEDVDSGGRGGDSGSDRETCTEAEDCSTWFCECEEGPPVNTRRCDNDICLHAEDICASSCRNFNTTWTGGYGGGPSDQSPDPDEEETCDEDLFIDNACADCQRANCCPEAEACSNSSSCNSLFACIVDCINAGGGSACLPSCIDENPAGEERFNALNRCALDECPASCGG